jgi:hypothetical protein
VEYSYVPNDDFFFLFYFFNFFWQGVNQIGLTKFSQPFFFFFFFFFGRSAFLVVLDVNFLQIHIY